MLFKLIDKIETIASYAVFVLILFLFSLLQKSNSYNLRKNTVSSKNIESREKNINNFVYT